MGAYYDGDVAQDVSVQEVVSRLPAALDAGDGGLKVHVENPVAAPDVSALALDATLRAVRDRLPALTAGDGGLQVHVLNETPATDVSALATAAKQDAQTALLTALAGVNYATGADMATVETKLDAIATNTANIKLDADHLTINSDALNLDVQGVETRLDTLNGKDFATQATLAQLKARADLLAADATVAAIGAQLPAALVGGRLDVNVGAGAINVANWPGSQTVHVDNFPASQPVSIAATVAVADATAEARLEAVRALLAGTVAVSLAVPGDQVADIHDGARIAVPVPGTPQALSAGQACKWVTITALDSNTDRVYLGSSDVKATRGAEKGLACLSAEASVTIPVSDASKVFVDARVAGEGVVWGWG